VLQWGVKAAEVVPTSEESVPFDVTAVRELLDE